MEQDASNREVLATPDQARAVIDEISRITTEVEPINGYVDQNLSVPKKFRWHKEVLFALYPEGCLDISNPTEVHIAWAAWDNPNRSRTSYVVNLTSDHELRLIKHYYPPSSHGNPNSPRKRPQGYESQGPEVSAGEAQNVIEWLRQITPAPSDEYEKMLAKVILKKTPSQ